MSNAKPLTYTNCRHRRHGQRGSSMLELALSVPLLLLILAGVMEFGRAFYAASEVSNAARAGVQYAAINSTNASDYSGMQNAALTDAANLSGMTASASKYCECTTGTATDCSTGTCTMRTYVKVVTSLAYSTIGTYPGIPNPITITSQATLRVQ